MTADKTPRRLGRGLDALLGDRKSAPTSDRTQPNQSAGSQPPERAVSELQNIPIADISPNHYQPRKEFSAAELKELADSIRTAGLLQPVTVRKSQDGYELVSGERRLRAASSLGWSTIPAIVRDYDDRTMLTLALVENLQRADLNPIEEAEGYARLAAEFDLTQNEIADLVGKDRSTIANLQRVLQLPAEIRSMLESGAITLGHARPLLAITDHNAAVKLARETVALGLSVRAIEDRVRKNAPRPEKPHRGRPRNQDTRSPEVRHVEDLLRARFQTDVVLVRKKLGKGELRVQFYSTDDLNRLLDLMGAIE